MDIFDTVKNIISPKEVVVALLGEPVRKSSNTFFYYSPFRAKERTASLGVTDKYITDFGTGEKYDIISFTSKLLNISTIQAVKYLAKEFNIALDNDYTSSQMNILKKRLQEKRLIEEKINEWHRHKHIVFCELYQYWKEQAKDFERIPVGVDNLQLVYYNIDFFEYLVDMFREASTEEIVLLYKQKERFNKYENDGCLQFCPNGRRKG